MRLDIRYLMRFQYSEAVTESHNEVRVRPADNDYQQVLAYRLLSVPPLSVLQTLDYWGTTVEHLGVRLPHTELELSAEATVETSPRPSPPPGVAVALLSDADFRTAHFELLEPSPHVVWSPGDEVASRAAAAVEAAGSVNEMVSAVVEEVRRTLAYVSGSTEIGVSLAELVEAGAGVCQDFAHLAIGMLRSVGVPARYVSGYLFAADETVLEPPPASPSADSPSSPSANSPSGTSSTGGPEVVTVQTHAWVEVAVPGHGWWALDPTNGGEAGERHVVIGSARDYGDVPPVRGTFTGRGAADVHAEVVIGKRALEAAAAQQQ